MKYDKDETFTRNETIALMNRNTATSFRKVADMIAQFEMDAEDAIDLLKEAADELQAQAMVVGLRDNI